jgi:hypothetical protein
VGVPSWGIVLPAGLATGEPDLGLPAGLAAPPVDVVAAAPEEPPLRVAVASLSLPHPARTSISVRKIMSDTEGRDLTVTS